jgi:hypothetical protein
MSWGSNSIGFYTSFNIQPSFFLSDGTAGALGTISNGTTNVFASVITGSLGSAYKPLNATNTTTVRSLLHPSTDWPIPSNYVTYGEYSTWGTPVTVSSAYPHPTSYNVGGGVLVLDGSIIYGQLTQAQMLTSTAQSASLAAAISGGLWACSSAPFRSSSIDYGTYWPFYNLATDKTASIAKVTGFYISPNGNQFNLKLDNGNTRRMTAAEFTTRYGYWQGYESQNGMITYLVGNTSSLNPHELGFHLSASLAAGTLNYTSSGDPNGWDTIESGEEGDRVGEGGGDDGGGDITSGGTGYSYSFGGTTQSILIRHNSNFDVFNKKDDWAISFWGSFPTNQTDITTPTYVVSKHIAERYVNEDGTITTQNSEVGSYPFKIGVEANSIFFETSDGTTTTNISHTDTYNDLTFRHFAFNKTGSLYEIWVNGSRVASQSVSYQFNINNQKDILIGNNSFGGTAGLSGYLDEFQLHRTPLSPSEIYSLADTNNVSGSYLQKNDVGYVFYKHGMIVVTDPRPRYQNVLLGDGNITYTTASGYQVDYRSTKVVEEVVALCEIGKEEFLVTSNPSARYTPSENEFQLAGFTMSSSFYPYVTTLGLYNDMGDLLATAKLGSPLKRRSDVDVTIQVKFDID